MGSPILDFSLLRAVPWTIACRPGLTWRAGVLLVSNVYLLLIGNICQGAWQGFLASVIAMTDTCTILKPRERIIGAARDLFRRHGINGIGVDAIVDAADSNKMTLYRHFGSKDDLVAACLKQAALEAESFWNDLEAAYPGDPMAQLKDWARLAADKLEVRDCNCEMASVAFQLADGDHPARAVIREFEQLQRERLVDLCRRAGILDAELCANTLILLVDGARANLRATGSEGPSTSFVQIAEGAIRAFAERGAAR